jgi:hypothetical protein
MHLLLAVSATLRRRIKRRFRMDEVRKAIFDNLSQIQTFPFEEKKGNLTYLSWANAWGLVKKAEPDAAFTVVTFDANGIRTEGGLPYQRTDIGFMVWTRVTIANMTQECYLPVMDHRNKAKQVPDILDINNTLMRCLVKNLALFGLGLHIYAGEDMPFGMPTHASEVDPETGEIKETVKVPVASSQSKAGGNGTSSTFAAAIARVGKLQAAEMPNAKRMAPMLFQGAELERYQEALAAREKELASPVAATAATSAAPSGLPI